MRYSQLLLEFDLKTTVSNYGPRVYEAAKDDLSFSLRLQVDGIKAWQGGYGYHWKKNERRVKKLETELAVKMLVDLDPTTNKKYFKWILDRYIKRGFLYEDGMRLTNALTTFQQLKNNRFFQRHPETAEWADIFKFENLHHLEGFLSLLIVENNKTSKNEAERPSAEEYTMIAETKRFRIVIPKTQKAANYFGRNTKWCTTSENGSSFDYYTSRGPLYIIIDKPNNRRWQFHFEIGQFMDEMDREIIWDEFPEEIWSLAKWPFERMDMRTALKMIKVPAISKDVLNVLPLSMIIILAGSHVGYVGRIATETLIERVPAPEKSAKVSSIDGFRILHFPDLAHLLAYDVQRFTTGYSHIWECGLIPAAIRYSDRSIIEAFKWCTVVINEMDDRDRYYFTNFRDSDLYGISSDGTRLDLTLDYLKGTADKNRMFYQFEEHGVNWDNLWPYISGVSMRE